MGKAARRLAAGLLAGSVLVAPTGAGAQEAARPPDVAFIGDSLGVRSEYHLRATFRNWRPLTILAITDGAYVSWVRRRWLDTILRNPPSIVVIGLGHGDGTHSTSPEEFRRHVRALLDALVPHVDCVRWLDVRERWTYYRNVNRRAAGYNRVLRQEADRYRKVEVVDYAGWAEQADDSYFEDDRLHPSRTGRRVFARMARDAADGCDPNLRTGPYWDVLDHEAHAPAVRWLRRNGVVRSDRGNGTFGDQLGNLPQPLIRSELARWLWRREGRPGPSPEPPWPDVSRPLQAPVGWVAEQDLLDGLRDGTFRAQRPVSRGELLRALWLLAGAPPAGEPAPWTDVQPRLAAAAAWAWSTGAMRGFGDGTFRPTEPVTKAAAARAVAPQDLPAPAARPTPGGPYAPPLRLHGDPPNGGYFNP